MKFQPLRNPRFLLVLLMLVLGLAYSTSTNGEWVFDDEQQVLLVSGFNSVADTFTVDCFGLFRPVKNLIFYVWANAMPENNPAWRLSAVILYVGLLPIAYLFFGLFFKKNPWLQLLSTSLWASAPAATTVVCWISSTNIIVGCYAFFLYFIFYEKAQERQIEGQIGKAYVWLFATLLMLAIACFSYEAAMAAPFLLLLKDYVQRFERLKNKRTWVFFFLSLFTLSLYFLLRRFHGGITNFDIVPTIPSESDLWVSLSSAWFYMIHAIRWFAPFGMQGMLIMFSPENHKVLVLFSVAIVLLLGFVLLTLRKKKPFIFLSLGWYGLALFPMANVIPLRNGPICDYYLFLPSIGLAVFFTWLVQQCSQTKARKIATSLAVVWVMAFCVTTLNWAPYWKTKKTMAERTLKWQPENFVILGLLAQEALDDENWNLAELYLEKGLKLAPWLGSLQYEKAMLHKGRGQYDEAIEILESLTIGQGHLAKPYVILAYIYDIHLDQWQKAEQLLTTAMEKPWDDKFSKTGAMNLAFIYLKTGREAFAAKVYESLKSRYPLDREIADNYMTLLEMDGLKENIQDPTAGL